MVAGLTPFITPVVLTSAGTGISWSSFPKTTATPAERMSALIDVCWSATSAMEEEANQQLRATVNSEQEWGPDRIITIRSSGWARVQLSRWPILQVLSAQVSGPTSPPNFVTIPLTAVQTEHSLLPDTGNIVPSGGAQGSTSLLVAPGYITWWNGRNGTLFSVSYLNGWPMCGIVAAASVGATTLSVDDITGWWNGTAGARGTIYDPPFREDVTVTGPPTPTTPGAISGPGTLPVTPLQFAHAPVYGQSDQTNQPILFSSMPRGLMQAGIYFGMHFGLLRGATAAVMQSAGKDIIDTIGNANSWYDMGAKKMISFARSQI